MMLLFWTSSEAMKSVLWTVSGDWASKHQHDSDFVRIVYSLACWSGVLYDTPLGNLCNPAKELPWQTKHKEYAKIWAPAGVTLTALLVLVVCNLAGKVPGSLLSASSVFISVLENLKIGWCQQHTQFDNYASFCFLVPNTDGIVWDLRGTGHAGVIVVILNLWDQFFGPWGFPSFFELVVS